MAAEPFLSIIIPAYNEQFRLPKTLPEVAAFVEQQPYSVEVIVVENGSTDETVRVVREFMELYPFIRLLQSPERGKGRALRMGMLNALGRYRFICDADLSMPLSELPKFFQHHETSDIVIGSREGPHAQRIGEPFKRHLIGRIANFIIRALVVRGYEDTQCGFKLFTAKAAIDLFAVQQLNGIGFDVELLFLAQKRNYKISVVPILWYYDPDTRIRLIDDSFGMFREIMQIRQNWKDGVYSPRSMTVVPYIEQHNNQYV